MIPVFDEHNLSEVKKLLSTAKKIVITTHFKPDADALGSSLGLANYLLKKGHSLTVISPSEFPEFLLWMEGSIAVIDFLKDTKTAKSHLSDAEIIFCLDFNDPRRVEGMHDELVKSSAKKILIDHHLDPKSFCDYTFSFPKIASTAEIIFQFIKVLDDQQLIDRAIAECIYAGIMTDTGSFRFNSVSPETHRVIAALMEAGARNDRIHELIYDTSSENRLRFLGNSLLNHMTVLKELNTVFFTATKADMDRFKHESGDLEGVVNYGLYMKNIKMSVLFSERDNIVKISFRSKGDFSVKAIAEKYFEGGGHKNAAGGRSLLSLNDTVTKFVALLPQYQEELTK